MFGIPDQFLLLAASLLGFAGVVLFAYGFIPETIEEEALYGYRETKRKRLLESNQLYALSLPMVQLFAHYFRLLPDSFLNLGEHRATLRDKLKRSGFMGAYTVNEIMGLSATSAFTGFFAGIAFTVLITNSPQFYIGFLFAALAAAFPFFSLNGAIAERLVQIDRQLPYSVELLVLSMRAGLDFITALDRVVTRGQEQDPDDPMTQELGIVLQEMRVGTARSDALINLCSRVNSDYLKSMVGAIIQSEKRGTPLAQVLEIQVQTIRNKRTQLIEKQAAQAAVKILFPLMFIFGSVVIVIMGAMVIRMQNAT